MALWENWGAWFEEESLVMALAWSFTFRQPESCVLQSVCRRGWPRGCLRRQQWRGLRC